MKAVALPVLRHRLVTNFHAEAENVAKDRIIGLLVSRKAEEAAVPSEKDLASVGTSALILKMAKTQDNRTQLLVQGLSRFQIED